jgi:hypothetical protein
MSQYQQDPQFQPDPQHGVPPKLAKKRHTLRTSSSRYRLRSFWSSAAASPSWLPA